MTVTTHDSKWRLLVGAAPLVGVLFLAWAAAQGEADVARSPTVRGVLAIIAAFGAAVAWWTARQLRAAPTIPVSAANVMAAGGQLSGLVALRGRAHALPDAAPLVSPGGELCLWFRHGEQFMHRYKASDSVRPFLLVDDTGQCVVLPAGADIDGSGTGSNAGSRDGLGGAAAIDGSNDLRTSERLLRDGDRIHVIGRFVPVSAEAVALQARAATLTRTETTQTSVMSNDPAAYQETRAAAARNLPFTETTSPDSAVMPSTISLPVIAAPGGTLPFVIRIGSDDGDGEGTMYGLLAIIDGLVLLVAGGLAVWAVFGAH
jgi:hypothetical protein